MNTEEKCAANKGFRTLHGHNFSGEICSPDCPHLAADSSKNYDKILISSPEDKLFPTKSTPTPSARAAPIQREQKNGNLLTSSQRTSEVELNKQKDSQSSTEDDQRVFVAVKSTEPDYSLRITTANMTDTSPAGNKMRMTQSGIIYTLHAIREPIVDYQETRGVSRQEEITFITLITSLCTQAYTAAITILVMLWNLIPLLDGFVYFARFTLDKLIDIIQTEDNKDKAIKAALFIGELTVILFIIFLIMGLIFMPVYVLTARLLGKVWSMIAW